MPAVLSRRVVVARVLPFVLLILALVALRAAAAGAAGPPVDLTVTGLDQDGGAVKGICATLAAPGSSTRVCDGADGTADGVIRFTAIPADTYTLTQTTTPAGYVAPAARTVTLHDTAANAETLTSGRTDVRLELVDQDGAPVRGACFNLAQGSFNKTVCDNAAISGGLNGATLFERVPVTSPVLTQTTIPFGSAALPIAPLTLTPGTTNVVTLTTMTLPVTSLTVTGVDQDARGVNGICATLAASGFSTRVCDNADGTADGVIAFVDLPASTYTLSQTTTPSGYVAPAAQTVTLSATESNAITVTSGRTDLRIMLVDQHGDPVPGACFNLAQDGYDRSLCDNASLSGGLDGVTLVERVPVNAPLLTQTTAPFGSAAIAPQTVTLTPGTANAVTITTTTLPRVELTVSARDQDGLPVTSACATLAAPGFSTRVCDGADGTADGLITFTGIPASDYTLTQTTTPSGYVAPAAQPVTLSATEPNAATLRSGRTDLEIQLLDQDGATVLDACFTLTEGDRHRTACDKAAASGGSNGVVRFERVATTTPTLTESSIPYGSTAMPVRVLDLTAGIANALTVETTTLARVGLVVTGVDQDGLPVNGICATLTDDGYRLRVCDGADGTQDGVIQFTGAPATTLTLTQTTTPSGYVAPAAQAVTLSAAEPNTITITSGRTDVAITMVDQHGTPVTGVCLNLREGGYDRTICDNANASGGLNGVVRFPRAPVSAPVLSQTTVPFGSDPIAPGPITVTPGVANAITVTTTTLPRVDATVTGTDQDGRAVTGICATLAASGFSTRVCDNADGAADGVIAFTGIPATTYTLAQTTTPSGYVAPAAQTVTLGEAGGTYTFVNGRTDVVITLVDEAGTPIVGACFNLTGGTYSRTVCDNAAASNGNDGTTRIERVPVAAVTLTQTRVPAGTHEAAPRDLALTLGVANAVLIEAAPPAPAITVELVDGLGNVLDPSEHTVDQGDGVFATVRFANATSTGIVYETYLQNGAGQLFSSTPSFCLNQYVAPGATQSCTVLIHVPAADRHDGIFDVAARILIAGNETPIVTSPIEIPVNPSAVAVTKAAYHDMDLTQPLAPGEAVDQGDTVWYAITVTNTGASKLTGTYISDHVVGSGNLYTGCNNRTLMPGETVTCQVSVAVTAAHRHAGVIEDYGHVTADQLDTAATSETLTIPVNQASVAIATTAARDGVALDPAVDRLVAGDELTVAVAVTNTGASALTGLTVASALAGDADCGAGPGLPITLASGASVTCTSASFVVTGDDVAAGTLTVTASVAALQLDAPATADPLTFAVLSGEVSVSLEAFLDVAQTQPATDPVDQRDSISFRVRVTNGLASPLSSAYVFLVSHGALSSFHSCFFYLGGHEIPSGATESCTIGYSVTLADRHAGSVDLTARLFAGELAGPIDATAVVLPVNPAAATLEVQLLNELGERLFPGDDALAEGAAVTIRYVITNTGPSWLTNASLSASGGVAGGIGNCPRSTTDDGGGFLMTIQSGEVVTCEVAHIVSAAEAQAGTTTYAAAVLADQLDAPQPSASATFAVVPGATTLTASVSAPASVRSDQTLTYAVHVANTGPITATGIVVADQFGAAITCPAALLTPNDGVPGAGADEMDCAAQLPGLPTNIYTNLRTDVAIANRFVVSAQQAEATAATPDPVVVARVNGYVEMTRHFEDAQGHPITSARIGETIVLILTVTNVSGAPLSGVIVQDETLGNTDCMQVVIGSDPGSDTITCSVTHVVTRLNKTQGFIGGLARVHATEIVPFNPGWGQFVDDFTLPNLQIAQANQAPVAGQQPVEIAVDSPAGPLPASLLALGGVTDADGDAIRVDAAAGGTTLNATSGAGSLTVFPDGTGSYTLAAWTDTTFSVLVRDAYDAALFLTVTIAPAPVEYTYTTTLSVNGEVVDPLTNAVHPGDTIQDRHQIDRIAGPLVVDAITGTADFGDSCGGFAVDPTWACAGVYTVTEADQLAGSVTLATTIQLSPLAEPITSAVTLTVEPAPPAGYTYTLTYQRDGEPLDPAVDTLHPGDVLAEWHLIENLSGDPLYVASITGTADFGGSCDGFAVEPIWGCLGVTTVTEADLAAGSITVTSTVDLAPPAAPIVRTTTFVVAPYVPTARGALDLWIEDADGSYVDPEWDVLREGGDYTVRLYASNAGKAADLPLTGVTIDAGPLGQVDGTCWGDPTGTLPVFAGQLCDVPLSITHDHRLAGTLTITATMHATELTAPLPTASATYTIAEPAAPAGTISVSLIDAAGDAYDPAHVFAAGDAVRVRFDVANTGNVDLDTVWIESSLGLLDYCPGDQPFYGWLPVGGSGVCVIETTITTAQSITGTAAFGGALVSDDLTAPYPSASVAYAVAPPLASATVETSVVDPGATPYDPATHVFAQGDVVTVWFAVTNTGDVTLTSAYLETTFGQLGDCTGQGGSTMTVAPGQQVLCAYGWFISAGDAAAGAVTYTATLHADQLTAPLPTDAVTFPVQQPPVAAGMVAIVVRDEQGRLLDPGVDTLDYLDEITIDVTFANTGTVPLTNVAVAAASPGGPITACTGGGATTLAPGESMTCTATRQVDLDDAYRQEYVVAGDLNAAELTEPRPSASLWFAVHPAPFSATITIQVSNANDEPLDPAVDLLHAGDEVIVRYVVTNTGAYDLSDLEFRTNQFDWLDPSCWGDTTQTLAAGASGTCVQTGYVISPEDADAGAAAFQASLRADELFDPVLAEVVFGVVSPPGEASVQITVFNSMGYPLDPATDLLDEGDVLTIWFEATNTGGSPLPNMYFASLTDGGAGFVDCLAGYGYTLSPGDSTMCAFYTYVVSAATSELTFSAEFAADNLTAPYPSATVTFAVTQPLPSATVTILLYDANFNPLNPDTDVVAVGDTIIVGYQVNNGPVALTNYHLEGAPFGTIANCGGIWGGGIPANQGFACTQYGYVVTEAQGAAQVATFTATIVADQSPALAFDSVSIAVSPPEEGELAG